MCNRAPDPSRIVSSLITICLLLFPVLARADKPVLVLDHAVYNFGTVSAGTKIDHEFAISNKGDVDLQIQRIVPACGCTASSVDKDVIAPGQTGKIKVTFDSSGFSGEKVKTIRVYTNDIDAPAAMLSMKGVIEPDVIVEPKTVYYGEVVRGREGEKATKVMVRVREGSKISIEGLFTNSKYLDVKELDSGTTKKTFQVSLKPDAPLGELRDRVIVKLKGGERSSVNLPVFASIKGQIRLSPSTLSFGVIEGKTILKRSVKLENLGKGSLEIKGVRTSVPALTSNIKTIRAGKLYVINLELDPTKVTSDLRATLEVETRGESDETLALSVLGVLPPQI